MPNIITGINIPLYFTGITISLIQLYIYWTCAQVVGNGFSSSVVELELGPINRLRYRQSITINNNRIIENNNTAYLRYAVLKFF